MTRRRLTAVDDPLTPGPPPPTARPPRPESARPSQGDTVALYVRLRIADANRLARAAFELRVHKRELVGALIAIHVDGTTEAGLAALQDLIDDFRCLSE